MLIRYVLIALAAFAILPGVSLAQSRVIVIDAGHGGEDAGYYSWTGFPEAELALRIAHRLEERLSDVPGLDVRMTRSGEGGPADETRLAMANSAGASLLLSIHADVASTRAFESGLIIYKVSDLSRQRVLARTVELGFARSPAAASERLDTRLEREAAFLEALTARMPATIPLVIDDGRGGLFDILLDANTPALFLEFPFLSNSDGDIAPPLTDRQIAVIDAVADAVIAHY